MILNNVSNFYNINDYLPILNGAIITDLGVILLVILGYIKSKTLKEWYNKYGLSGILADVLSIVIGIIITRFIYPYIFSDYSIVKFIIVAVSVQLVHDLMFAAFFQTVPRNQSAILDTFKDYANELGPIILVADASMIISTIILSSYMASYSNNTNIIILIICLYLVPYFLYSIK